jgi:hypothetical protein
MKGYGSIAVHENPYGDVVVRQEADAMEEDDHWVAIPVQDAEYIAKAIIDKAREIRAGWQQPAKQPPRQQPESDRQPTLALPAPNGKTPTVPHQRNGGTGTAAKAGVA